MVNADCTRVPDEHFFGTFGDSVFIWMENTKKVHFGTNLKNLHFESIWAIPWWVLHKPSALPARVSTKVKGGAQTLFVGLPTFGQHPEPLK